LAEAQSAIESVLRVDASNLEALLLISEVYGRLGKHQFSVQAALRVAKLDSNNMEAVLALAAAYHRAGDVDKCDKCFDVLVERAAAWLRARFFQQLAAGGDVDENSLPGRVVLAFHRSVEQTDVLPLATYNLGRLLFALKAFDLARQAYERTLELDPEMAEPYACIGELEFLRDQFQPCLEWLDEARRCQWMHTKTGLLFNRATMAQRIAAGDMTLGQVDRYAARALVRVGQFVEASRMMQSACEWQPWDVDGVRQEVAGEYLVVGQSLQEQQGIEAAIEVWESARELARQAKFHDLFLQLGHAYVQAAMAAREKQDRGQMLDWMNRARNLAETPPIAITPEVADAWNELRTLTKQAVGKGTGLLLSRMI
jgi:tetratricopeptide (TPR) repeat protein